MGTSVALAAKFAAEKGCSGLLITLGDQPKVDCTYLSGLVKAFNGQGVASGYDDGKKGVPAIFPSRLFKKLQSLKGDRGAKKLIDESFSIVAIGAMGLDIDKAG